jgi:4-amino-4-deoxy-L-arabinose transferase-like glycosyltransferase
VLTVLLVDPRGDVPLNDDWNFAMATWHFAETGEFRFARMTGMSLRAQVVWGALWTVLFGKSFEVLRFSTLFLSLSTLLVVTAILRRAGVGRFVRLLAASALLFHPIYFSLSFTYMTHIPYIFALAVAFYCNYRGLSERQIGFLAIGSAAVIVAYFIRQTGVVYIFPPLAALLLFWRDWPRKRWLLSVGTVVMPLLLFVPLFLFTPLLSGYREEMVTRFAMWEGSTGTVILNALNNVFRITQLNFHFTALLFLPLLIPVVMRLARDRRLALASFLALPFMIPFAVERLTLGYPFPYDTGGYILVNLGLGPLTLRDTWVFGYVHPFRLPASVGFVLTLLVVLLAALLVGAIVMALMAIMRRQVKDRLLAILALTGCAVGSAALYVSGFYFDRYSLDAFWPAVLLFPMFVVWNQRSSRLVSIVLVVLFAAGSVMLTSEYLSWNRARWDAFRWLQTQGVGLERIDGGYEINQFLIGGWDGPVTLNKGQFSVIDDEFIITFNDVRGYQTIATFPYRRLGRQHGVLRVQERTTGFEPRFDF